MRETENCTVILVQDFSEHPRPDPKLSTENFINAEEDYGI